MTLATKFINEDNPIVIDWLKSYLRSSYRYFDYLHYDGEITHYLKKVDYRRAYAHKTNRLLVYNKNILIANISIYKFKRYCRTKFKQL